MCKTLKYAERLTSSLILLPKVRILLLLTKATSKLVEHGTDTNGL